MLGYILLSAGAARLGSGITAITIIAARQYRANLCEGGAEKERSLFRFRMEGVVIRSFF
jgi:hypothetical protein